jgi:hypothetical protein
MPKPAPASPFQCGGAVFQFPDRPIGSKLVIRVEDGTGTKVHIRVKDDPSSGSADIYLLSGEAYEFRRKSGLKGSDIRIINITGDPKIFYSLE